MGTVVSTKVKESENESRSVVFDSLQPHVGSLEIYFRMGPPGGQHRDSGHEMPTSWGVQPGGGQHQTLRTYLFPSPPVE